MNLLNILFESILFSKMNHMNIIVMIVILASLEIKYSFCADLEENKSQGINLISLETGILSFFLLF